MAFGKCQRIMSCKVSHNPGKPKCEGDVRVSGTTPPQRISVRYRTRGLRVPYVKYYLVLRSYLLSCHDIVIHNIHGIYIQDLKYKCLIPSCVSPFSVQNNYILSKKKKKNHRTKPTKIPLNNMQFFKSLALVAIMAGLGLAASVPPPVLRRADLQNAEDGDFSACE